MTANSATLVPGLAFNASDGHGQWERDGSKFEAKFHKLVFDTSAGYVANADVSENIVVFASDASKFAGQFTIQFSFLNGNPPVCGSGTLAAKRNPRRLRARVGQQPSKPNRFRPKQIDGARRVK